MQTRIEPYRIKAVEPISLTTRAQRERAIETAGWNLFRLPARLVTIDLLTDSGLTGMSSRQWAALFEGDESYAGSESFKRFRDAVRNLTGMPHVIPTHQGRAAERLLFEAMLEPGDVVAGNTHFDTTRANIERVGAQAVDLPVAAVSTPLVELPFKGNCDLGALTELLAWSVERAPQLLIMTVTSNTAGGQPVSMENLRAVRALCDMRGVPVFLDAARFAENAWFMREREPELRGLAPARIARMMFSLADGCLLSAKKDGLAHIGGFLALRDAALAKKIREAMVVTEGFPTYGGLAGRDLDAIALGLEEVLEPSYLADRIAQVRDLGDRLHEAGVPTVRPPGGHAIYIEARAFAPHLAPTDLPGQAIACALFLDAGIRATEVGQLMRGRRGPNGQEAAVDLDLVRLAVPRRVYTTRQLAYVAEAVIDLYARRRELRPLDIVAQPAALRHFSARLRPRAEVRELITS